MGSGLSKKYIGTYGSQLESSESDEVREDSPEYSTRPQVIRKSSGTSNVDGNAERMSGKFKPNKYGNFGKPGKNCRIIEGDNPITESAEFYDQIGKGGEVRRVPGLNGTVTKLDDGTEITYRIITRTKDSPAVDINIKNVNTNINGQKIHFVVKSNG